MPSCSGAPTPIRSIACVPASAPASQVFDRALAGGGAKSINFQELAADLAQITFDVGHPPLLIQLL